MNQILSLRGYECGPEKVVLQNPRGTTTYTVRWMPRDKEWATAMVRFIRHAYDAMKVIRQVANGEEVDVERARKVLDKVNHDFSV